MAIAFVLGNGRSRLNIDPAKLQKHGKVYGCNAIYRDFMPDYLIAVDPKMVIELNDQQIQSKTTVWTNPNTRYKDYTGFNYFIPSKGWSSGPTALWLASTHGYDQIYILGFDYQGIENKFNNVYADSKNYKKSSEPPTFYGNWSRQTESVIREFTNIKYSRVVDDNALEFGWASLKNYQSISFKQLRKELGLQN